jgi:hypothetical protein
MDFGGYGFLNIVALFLASLEHALPKTSRAILPFGFGIIPVTLFAMSGMRINLRAQSPPPQLFPNNPAKQEEKVAIGTIQMV